jgi:aminopeptidase N
LDEYFAESKEKKEPIIRYSYAEQKDLFDAHSYNKGAWVLHMLRKLLGDDIFWKALNIYLTKNQFQNTEIHHLRFAFEEASGQDLNWFFDQWFLAPGHPELKIKYIYDVKKGLVQITILQTQDTKKYPIFRLPAKLSIWDNNERTDYSIEIDNVESSFTYKTSAQPNLVLFDSDFTLLAEIDYPKISSELVYQYNQNQDNAIVKLEAVTEMINLRATDVIPTLQKAIQDTFWGIREQAIKRFDRYDADQNVVALIKEKATKDPKAFVRAAAIDVISSFSSIEIDDLRKIYIQAMNDSSYSVVGAALYDYLSTQPDDAEKVAQSFNEYLQPTILNTIADYFTLKGDPKKYSWFEDKIKRTSGFTQFDLLGFFGDYLLNENNLYENREKGVKLLNTIALHGKPYYVRFSAYKSLQLLEKKVVGVTEMLKQIKSIETNKKLFQMYDGME